jgi:U3 small nucleolar RNA-associated protein 4
MSVVLTPSAPAASTVSTKVVNPLSTSIVATFEDSYHRRLAYTSGPSCTSAVRIARQARFACCARDTGLSIWRILQRQESKADDSPLVEPAESGGWEKILDIELNAHTNIIASAISDDGRWLVVSDLYETRLFALENEVSARSLSSTSAQFNC